ncbi:MAG: DUF3185 domain-containing protein [Candidatus Eisenbacteria bacterium]|uniref:DUF3185 domain-containing protein n=1 Tax=Eiseniibacteriota bacterium TaxID=2212470 RepID=A0A849SWC9_UNCEI|nr:DUF3185 domain-containing protein [Candidatus Eisenbacteria bacterium]
MRSIGVVLVVLGVLALAYQGFSYTKREKVIDLGPIQATADTKKHVSIPPIAGGVAVVAGVTMMLISRRQD